MEKILNAIGALEDAVEALKADKSLTFDEIIAAGTMVTQIGQMVPAWRIQAGKVKAAKPAPTAAPTPEYVTE